MQSPVRLATIVAVVATAALSLHSADAKASYVAKIPNGDGVTGVAALGHVDPAGGGERNKFGLAFAKASYKWTKELCEADSDGDGQTNGQELGDPCCEWTTDNAKLQRKDGLSHPGDASSKTDAAVLSKATCGGSKAGSKSSESASSSTPKPTTKSASGGAAVASMAAVLGAAAVAGTLM